ncbi:hypothetical protein [Leptospirillum ferrooxidans]|uniref:hypothetical protein n=1 Tax=Leptospirillum ferrooxidans TaxID=180 RepID=UPI0002F0D2FB|nr:hypothetical protein [Leptospirillum ferrooxidans]
MLCYDLLRGSGRIPAASFLDRLLVREERLLSLLALFGGGSRPEGSFAGGSVRQER